MKNKIRLFYAPVIVFIAFLIAGTLVLSGCSDDSTGPQDQQVTAVSIHPENASLEVGEQLDFSVFALTATGDTVDTDDLNIEWQWWSTDSEVFTVEPGGMATGQNPGEAFCVVEAIVDVTQNTIDIPERLIVEAGFTRDDQIHFQTASLKLSAKNREISPLENENVSFKKRMRFTGRDSAFVVVF